MRIVVKATAIDDDGEEHEVKVTLDWESCRVDPRTGERVLYGSYDSWHVRVPPKRSPQPGEEKEG